VAQAEPGADDDQEQAGRQQQPGRVEAAGAAVGGSAPSPVSIRLGSWEPSLRLVVFLPAVPSDGTACPICRQKRQCAATLIAG
jgi:hypothetical protein